MLARKENSNGVVYYASPLLDEIGVKHAFSTRIGGISPAPFDSMNLGNPSGCDVQDASEHIQQNYRLLQGAIGHRETVRCSVHQVHGGDVVWVRRDKPFTNNTKADALVSDDPMRLLCVRTADCVPILLATQNGARVSAVHAGWRGVIAEVVPHAIAAMQGEPKQIRAAIGPCIGFEAFEVGAEVLAEFSKAFGEAAPIKHMPNDKGRVDLRSAVRLQLLRCGLQAQNIDETDRCSFRDSGEFFSHRREHGITGRMAAIIVAGS